MQKTFITYSEQQTAYIAGQVASIAQRGDVFALYGTLGMGKSVFARAFIQELTHASEVPSPTFTLVQSYPFNDLEIHHFDLYRLRSPEEVFELGFEDLLYSGISLIEWPEKAGSYLPRGIFKITISADNDKRIISIETDEADKQQRLEQIHDD